MNDERGADRRDPTSGPGESTRDAQHDRRTDARTRDVRANASRTPDSPDSASPIPGPHGSNATGRPKAGGSRAAGLDRDREALRNPGESEEMNSAISGESNPIPEEQDDKARGNVNDPLPNKPDPEGVPRTQGPD